MLNAIKMALLFEIPRATKDVCSLICMYDMCVCMTIKPKVCYFWQAQLYEHLTGCGIAGQWQQQKGRKVQKCLFAFVLFCVWGGVGGTPSGCSRFISGFALKIYFWPATRTIWGCQEAILGRPACKANSQPAVNGSAPEVQNFTTCEQNHWFEIWAVDFCDNHENHKEVK